MKKPDLKEILLWGIALLYLGSCGFMFDNGDDGDYLHCDWLPGREQCGAFVVERGSMVYMWIKLGSQVWMAQNLNYAPEVHKQLSFTQPRYYLDSTNLEKGNEHGALYNWTAAMEVCPHGWRLPSNQDWQELIDFAGGEAKAGYKLKSSTEWGYDRGGDNYNFTALASGKIESDFSYYIRREGSYWWSSTEYSEFYAYNYQLSSGDAIAQNFQYEKKVGFSVRCIKGAVIEKEVLAGRVIISENDLVLAPQQSYSLEAVVIPYHAVDKSMIWSSSDTAVIKVAANGTITSHQLGYATITATPKVGGKADSCVIWVKNSFMDERDSNSYFYIEIGDQTWMAENLRYLPSVFIQGDSSTEEPRYYVFGLTRGNIASIKFEKAKELENYLKYGVLYNYPAALEACPAGWHLPNAAEWQELLDFTGADSQNHAFLKSINGWHSGNIGGNGEDLFGFNALPGGAFIDEFYEGLLLDSYWWGTGDESTPPLFHFSLFYGPNSPPALNIESSDGLSIRCVKSLESPTEPEDFEELENSDDSEEPENLEDPEELDDTEDVEDSEELADSEEAQIED